MNIKYIIILLCLSCGAHDISGQSLDSLLSRAYDNNPQLRALQLEYEAALQKGPQVNQLPDPTVGLGVPVLRPQTRLGGQVLMISAVQMFPWVGTLKAKEDVVLTMAKAKYERIAATRLNIDYQIKSAYYNLYLLQTQQTIIRKNIRIFETIEKVSMAKIESGKSIASDALSVRVKIEELKNQIQVIEAQKQRYFAPINETLNNPTNNVIRVDVHYVALAELTYDLEQYREKIQSNHPLIRQIDWKIESSEKEILLNTLSGKPSFGLGLDYSLVNGRDDAMPVHNGRDILIPKVMVSIPINRNKYAAKEREEQLQQQAFNLQKDQLTNSMLSNIQQYKSSYDSAKLMYELAHKQIKISKSAYNILLVDYSSKGRRFDELLKLQSNINRYELAIEKAVIMTHMAKFKIERITDF